MPKNTRVKGHWLVDEGAPHDAFGHRLPWYAPQGCGKCSCGALSDWLDSTRARQRWHSAHKADIVAKHLSEKGKP